MCTLKKKNSYSTRGTEELVYNYFPLRSFTCHFMGSEQRETQVSGAYQMDEK
jgi:hypothetical protein